MIILIWNAVILIISILMMGTSISDAVLIDREIYFTRWRDDPTYPNNLKYCANEDNINLLYERIRIIRDNPVRYPPTEDHVINGTLEMIQKNIEQLNFNKTKFIQLEDSQPWYGILKRFLWHDVIMTCDYQLQCHNYLALDVLGYGHGFINPISWVDVSSETRSTKSHASYQIDQFYEQIKSTNTQLERFVHSDGKNSEYSQSMIIQSLDQLIKNTNDVMNGITKSYIYNLERNFKNSIIPRPEYEQYFMLHSKILRWIMDLTSDIKEQFMNRYLESTTTSTSSQSHSRGYRD
ncbi:hypothetical protein HUG17_10230 [Dermatophagoides farinae]|uniref:Uncharacterized protein n=1 Tax=Dermatophagoides farinae TaxID=6954 RepID=A0A9D4NR37_DERFA|nr:uncharacterized protein LOC124498441 [Dermatophagoides farinae]KAH7636260.1 hypothetical protein HUG17_10230 [Dermatophagoides farinae]